VIILGAGSACNVGDDDPVVPLIPNEPEMPDDNGADSAVRESSAPTEEPETITPPPPANRTTEQIENMTDEEFFIEVQKIKHRESVFGVADFYMPDDFGVELIEGEYRWWIYNKSADSFEEAKELATSDIWKYTVSSIDFIGENDYYYIFRVNRVYETDDKEYVMINRELVFKSSAIYIDYYILDDFPVSYYKFPNRDIVNLNRQTVQDLLDISAFFAYLPQQNPEHSQHMRIIHRVVEETEDEYIYTLYYVSYGIYGYGVANLRRREYAVDKTTGRHDFAPTGHADFWYEPTNNTLLKEAEF
jgi:hypothetical protein